MSVTQELEKTLEQFAALVERLREMQSSRRTVHQTSPCKLQANQRGSAR
jgi:hypothetical protein